LSGRSLSDTRELVIGTFNPESSIKLLGKMDGSGFAIEADKRRVIIFKQGVGLSSRRTAYASLQLEKGVLKLVSDKDEKVPFVDNELDELFGFLRLRMVEILPPSHDDKKVIIFLESLEEPAPLTLGPNTKETQSLAGYNHSERQQVMLQPTLTVLSRKPIDRGNKFLTLVERFKELYGDSFKGIEYTLPDRGIQVLNSSKKDIGVSNQYYDCFLSVSCKQDPRLFDPIITAIIKYKGILNIEKQFKNEKEERKEREERIRNYQRDVDSNMPSKILIHALECHAIFDGFRLPVWKLKPGLFKADEAAGPQKLKKGQSD